LITRSKCAIWLLLLKSHDREELINAAIFFASNARHYGKIKLLYLLDFEHHRQTGRSVTGLEYHAMRMGSVPLDLYQEWDALEPDFAEAVDIVPEQVIDFVREAVRPKRALDDSHFTRRELRLMAERADRFRTDYSKPMVNVTHAERGPWSGIRDNGRGDLDRIPYSLAIPDDDPHAEVIRGAAVEREGIRRAQMH